MTTSQTREPRKFARRHEGACLLCGAPYVAAHGNARYCTPACRAEAGLIRAILDSSANARYGSLADRLASATGDPDSAISRLLERAARGFDERERDRQSRAAVAQRQLDRLGPRSR